MKPYYKLENKNGQYCLTISPVFVLPTGLEPTI